MMEKENMSSHTNVFPQGEHSKGGDLLIENKWEAPILKVCLNETIATNRLPIPKIPKIARLP